MATTYVSIDIETTGLNPVRDSIIEVAAITFEEANILDEFSSLVNPERDIPDYITNITGITDEMVADAPTMFSIRSRLRPKLASHVLVGHNIEFDLSFLREERLALGNHRVDTVTLATILYPEAGRFNLEYLAIYLNLPSLGEEQTHRALDDAELTIELFLALKEKALTLEFSQLEEIVEAGRRLGWSETIFFEDVLAEKGRMLFENGDQSPRGQKLARLYWPDKIDGRSPTPKERPDRIDPELVSSIIRPGGNFDQAFADFEYRPQQVEMLETVVEAFNYGAHLMVEAGTGTGKSMAYLIPAAFWASENGRRVVISTNTINLQDQLVQKDIPELLRLLPLDIRAAVRKGRSNYLCTRLFQQMRHTGPSNDDEMALYARILQWLPRSKTGDVAELTLRTPGERIAWTRMNGESASCTQDHCAAENCPLHVARRQAEVAHIVVVNHALLLSDLANNSHILPEFYDLVVDEAHHLESAVTGGLSFRADKRFLETVLDEVTKPRAGIISDLLKRVKDSLPPELSQQFETIVAGMRQEAHFAQERLDEFFAILRHFFADAVNNRSQFAQQVRITPAVRVQPGYDEVEMAWDNFNKILSSVVDGFIKMSQGLREAGEQFDIAEVEDLQLALSSNGRSLEETRANLDGIIIEPKDEMIYWIEIFKERISLHAAPLHVGPLVEENIFQAKETVVLTSATLRTAGPEAPDEPNFAYMRNRINAFDVDELAVGSPFNYKNNTLLYLVTDIPEPNQPGYQRYLESAIIDVATAIGGRTMVLFTSYGQLNQTAKAIEGPLAKIGITTLAQRQGSSRQQLLEQFKRPGSKSVLLGTRSFWEGVDVPGDALQAVLIAKIPFDVPSDPIFAARSETFESSFFEYSIPEAVLRFRQGFGRLNRRGSDEGVVIVLDKRILTKRYGQLFIDALPECTVLRQKVTRVGELTVRWLNREKK